MDHGNSLRTVFDGPERNRVSESHDVPHGFAIRTARRVALIRTTTLDDLAARLAALDWNDLAPRDARGIRIAAYDAETSRRGRWIRRRNRRTHSQQQSTGR